VITAKINGVNPYTVFTRILAEVSMAKTIEDYERLADLILPTKKAATTTRGIGTLTIQLLCAATL
jgi:hypothetical protein